MKIVKLTFMLISFLALSFSVYAQEQESVTDVTAGEMLSNEIVRDAVEDAWQDSGAGTEVAHEEGGWIYRSIDEDGNVTYSVDRWPPG